MAGEEEEKKIMDEVLGEMGKPQDNRELEYGLAEIGRASCRERV